MTPELEKAVDEVLQGPPGTAVKIKLPGEKQARVVQNQIRRELVKYFKLFPEDENFIILERRREKKGFIISLERLKEFKIEIVKGGD